MALQLCEDHAERLVDKMSQTPLHAYMEEDERNPVLFAVFRISTNFMSVLERKMVVKPIQMAAFTSPTDQTCPVCWVNEHCTCGEENCADWWLDYSIQDALDEFSVV